ncbi:TonB-dependent receptor, partial [Paraburkholderia sp. SIMBA_054]
MGNADLQPEYSRTRTLGFVYSPHFVEGLDFSLDWYKISISNVIT